MDPSSLDELCLAEHGEPYVVEGWWKRMVTWRVPYARIESQGTESLVAPSACFNVLPKEAEETIEFDTGNLSGLRPFVGRREFYAQPLGNFGSHSMSSWPSPRCRHIRVSLPIDFGFHGA